MIYKIIQGGQTINTILAELEFVKQYCAEHGYEWEPEDRLEEPESVEHSPYKADQLRADVDYLAALAGADL